MTHPKPAPLEYLFELWLILKSANLDNFNSTLGQFLVWKFLKGLENQVLNIEESGSLIISDQDFKTPYLMDLILFIKWQKLFLSKVHEEIKIVNFN